MTSKKVNAANDDMAKSAKSTTSAFKLLGGAMAALGVGALVTSFARTVTESERLKGSLKTMTGSTEDAAFAFAELEKFASQTPFTLDQSVEGFIKLKALGLDPSERALRSYGNTSAAMGKDMMQMVEAVADAATGEFERLKEFGIKASKAGRRRISDISGHNDYDRKQLGRDSGISTRYWRDSIRLGDGRSDVSAPGPFI